MSAATLAFRRSTMTKVRSVCRTRNSPVSEFSHIAKDTREVSLSLDNIASTEIEDLLFLQDELTEDFLDVFEMNALGVLEKRASDLVERFEAARLAS